MRHILLAILLLLAPGVQARTVVLELFTSQGCSSCPPADKVLTGLASRPDVIALSLPVDYWDHLGWVDNFARPEHTALQRAYNARFKRRGVYTPQLVINGGLELVGSRAGEVTRLVEAEAAGTQAIAVRAAVDDGGVLNVALDGVVPGGTLVELLWVRAHGSVPVRRGENGGRTLTYSNIVLDDALVGAASQTSRSWRVGADVLARTGADFLVVLVRNGVAGPVLTARQVPLQGG